MRASLMHQTGSISIQGIVPNFDQYIRSVEHLLDLSESGIHMSWKPCCLYCIRKYFPGNKCHIWRNARLGYLCNHGHSDVASASSLPSPISLASSTKKIS